METINLSGHIVVCGWNGHGKRLLDSLIPAISPKRAEIVLVSRISEEAFENLRSRFTDAELAFVRGDFAEENVLRRARIREAAAAIILGDGAGESGVSGADEKTVLAALAIKSLNPKLKTVAQVYDPANAAHLRRADVDEIIVTGEHQAFLLAAAATAPGIPQVVNELLNFTDGNDLWRTPIPADYIGKSFGELANHYREKHTAILIGVIREEKEMSLEDVLSHNISTIDDFIRSAFEKAGEAIPEGERRRSRIRLNPGDDYALQKDEYAVLIAPAKTGRT